MTQSVDSQTLKKLGLKINTYNFLDVVVEPPARIAEAEFLKRIADSEKEEDSNLLATCPYQQDNWLFQNEDALRSVKKGLSEEGTIYRGSFAKYVD